MRYQDAALAPVAHGSASWRPGFNNQAHKGDLQMAFKNGAKSGGRVKGSRNKAVVAREAAMAEAAKLLSASDGDKFDGNAHKLLEAIYKNPAFPISLRNDAAKAALRVEAPTDDSIQPYVCIMPMPIPDLDEWRKRYMTEAPNASPEDRAWAEHIAKAALKAEENRASPQDKAPWLDDKEESADD